MSIHLKPCPFCGSETAPRIVGNGIGDYYVRCDEDEDTGEGCNARTSDCRCESPEYAAERWNRRAGITRADVADLEQDLIDARKGWEACADTLRKAEVERDALSEKCAVAVGALESIKDLSVCVHIAIPTLERCGDRASSALASIGGLPAHTEALLHLMREVEKCCAWNDGNADITALTEAWRAYRAVGRPSHD